MILNVYNMSVFPHVFSIKWRAQRIPLDVIEPVSSKKWRAPGHTLDVIKPVSSKKWNFVFFGNTQLVSKEWEIVNLEVIPDHNPEL